MSLSLVSNFEPIDQNDPIYRDFLADLQGNILNGHKSNPRLESVGSFAASDEVELGHRIARRGITYGGPLSATDNLDDLPEKGVGLLFMCYQSDIWEQFEFIQRFWCNNPNFLEPENSSIRGIPANPNYDKTGLDAVIGQMQGTQFDPVIGEPLIPDRDDLLQKARELAGEPDANEWISIGIRTCGEDFGDKLAPVEFGGNRSSNTSWMDTGPSLPIPGNNPEGFVQLVETAEALKLRKAQRAAAFRFMARLLNVDIAAIGNGVGSNVQFVGATEDGLGTTYHECGTLWMGDDPETSVTDVHGRFHHVANAYVVDQALFPTAGSANPVPTGLALARKVALDITSRYEEEPAFADGDAGFQSIFNGSFDGAWGTVGASNFTPLTPLGQPPIIEAGKAGADSVLGLLYYQPNQYKSFILRLEWKAFSIRANSGVFLRIPNPAGRSLDDPFYASCTEIQIDETGKNFVATRTPQSVFGGFREKTGAIYTLAPATQGASKVVRPRFTPDGPWNVYEITVQDDLIVVVLNGVEVSRANISSPQLKEGYLALQCHTEIVQFRKIRIKELP